MQPYGGAPQVFFLCYSPSKDQCIVASQRASNIKSYPKLEMQNKFAVRPLRETPIRICHCICKLQYLQSKYVFFILTVIH